MLGEIPVAGFFCAGELGRWRPELPARLSTASIALFPAVAP